MGLQKGLLTVVAIVLVLGCQAQYFQFSQYSFTPQRINPALVACSNDAHANLIYRNQATDGGFHLNSNSLSASYPILSRKGIRWAGLGISFLDDRSGQAGIFNTQEIGLSYAINVFLSKWQSLSLGVTSLYQAKRFDLQGLHTGSQYIPDRGFDESTSNGEGLGLLKSDFITFSSGIHWQQLDRNGNKLAYWNFSFFDFNKPNHSFLGSQDPLNTTFILSAGFLIFKQSNMRVTPEVLLTRNASNTLLNLGTITSYKIQLQEKNQTAQLNIITKYVVGRSGILGIQIHNNNISFGISYDFPVIKKNVANTGAVELGLELRKPVKAKKKSSTLSQKKTTRVSPIKKVTVQRPLAIRDSTFSQKEKVVRTAIQPVNNISARLRQKQDSLKTIGSVGAISHEPIVLEKATLHFNFEFNSTDLNEQAREYFDALALALLDNPELRIRLVGHTDNVGSDKFNLKLSLYRAQSIKEYLINKGIDSIRIDVEGKGIMEPLNENKTPEDRARNRRVELTIFSTE